MHHSRIVIIQHSAVRMGGGHDKVVVISTLVAGINATENAMEDKKLNFNQPLLSVRRYIPTVSSRKCDQRITNISQPVIPRLPPHKSELKSGPIRNPGAVPFVWEQIPGQPKQGMKPTKENTTDIPPTAPKLPPGRSPKANQQDYLPVYSSTTSDSNKRLAVDVPSESHRGPSHDENVEKIESNKEMKEEESSGDEAYVDALDTLSRTESFFLNCSMSGLSGVEDLYVDPSGSVSTDLPAREFMMDRFLPAAKAMASKTSQCVIKKQPVVLEEPQHLKKTVNHYKPSLRYGPSFAKRYSHYQEDEEEDEESDDDYHQRQNLPALCGFLPRFCLRNSLCLLNPVPAMSIRAHVPISSANKVQPRSSLAGQTENESWSVRTELKLVDKIQTPGLHDNKTKSRKNERGRLESHSTSAHGGAVLPCPEEKEVLAIPRVKMHAGTKEFESYAKGFKTFEYLMAGQGHPNELNSGSPVAEKTLYVDTVQKVESPNLRRFSPDTHETNGVSSSSLDEDNVIISRRMDQMDTTNSSLEDFRKLKTINGEEKLLSDASRIGASSIFSWVDKSGMELPKAFVENQVFWPDSTTMENIQVAEKEATKRLENQPLRAVTLGNSHQNCSGQPVSPPLPKSPSDSWLWRTLPSMSANKSSLCSYLGAATNHQNQCSMAPTSDIK